MAMLFENYYTIQIFKDGTYHNYINTEGEIINNKLHIHGYYLGSTSSQGNIGTIYYLKTQEIIPVQLRVIKNITNDVLFEYNLSENDIIKLLDLNKKETKLPDGIVISELSEKEFLELFKNIPHPRCLNDRPTFMDGKLKIHYRDLHRFENYPYEISGISFNLD